MPDYPNEGALRGGHVPGAKSVPWVRAADADATFRGRGELEAIYAGEDGLYPDDDVIVYCRIGERTSHLVRADHLLGYPNVRNYDGPVGEQPSGFPLPAGTARDRRAAPPVAGDRRRLQRPPGPGPAATAAGVLPGPARPARALRRAPQPARAGAGMPITAFPGGRSRTGLGRAPVLRGTPRKRRPPEASPPSCTPACTGSTRTRCWPRPRNSPASLGLQDLVSPLRLRGMAAMLSRIKRQIREQRG